MLDLVLIKGLQEQMPEWIGEGENIKFHKSFCLPLIFIIVLSFYISQFSSSIRIHTELLGIMTLCEQSLLLTLSLLGVLSLF